MARQGKAEERKGSARKAMTAQVAGLGTSCCGAGPAAAWVPMSCQCERTAGGLLVPAEGGP